MAMDKSEGGNVPNPDGEMILVIDDDVRASRLQRFVLEEEGFSVACVGTGEEALEMLPTTSPSLVLLDIMLPKMDGFTTCQKIRETSQVPIIIVTGEGRDEEKVRGLEMGADDYITKPFSTNELAARVKVVLRRINNSQSRPSPARTRPSEPDFSLIERNGKVGELSDGYGEENGKVDEIDGKYPRDTNAVTQDSYGQNEDTANGLGRGAAAVTDNENNDGSHENDENYEGAVKLLVETRGAIKNMVGFVDTLRDNPQFHLLRMVSNAQRDGMDIWLRLREPSPLRATLLEANGVTNVEVMDSVDLDPETGAETRVLKVLLD